MFVIERQGITITAGSPEEAVQKFRKELAREDEDVTYFNVWDSEAMEFFVVAHNIDDGPPEFERVVHLSREEHKNLVEAMIHKARCDDEVLRQICEMAAAQINTQDACDDWVG